MVFSSISFLFVFLPFVFLIYIITPTRFRFIFLLLANLLFYFWGEGKFLEVMIYSIILNYISGMLIEKYDNHLKKKILFASILLNLLILFYYKYFNFFSQVLIDAGVNGIRNPDIHLPIGISFFTFQGVSYVIDVYRKDVQGTKNFVHFAMYISLFSQLIAGPIVRYKDVLNDILNNILTHEKIVYGIQRFIIGLAKKVIIANTVGLVADRIFEFNPANLSTTEAWIGLICYSLQIYFDFSGYSDMAIGLGSMFGFKFLENFNYPYIANSIQDYWRRWHISLSTWFRDYLYIPLGGSKVSNLNTYTNLILVFVLCGFWHGANWTFLIWGLWHGSFLITERFNIFKRIISINIFTKHIYTLLVINIGWVFFRAESLPKALGFIKTLFTYKGYDLDIDQYLLLKLMNTELYFIICLGIIAATPFYKSLFQYIQNSKNVQKLMGNMQVVFILRVFEHTYFILLFLICVSYLASGTYNPFIYFRF